MERQDVERAFRDFCLDNGFSLIPPPEADGEVHRFDSIDSRGKPRRRGAWYKLYADGYRPTGIVGDHRGDQLKWVADAPAVKMSPQERAAFARVKEQKAAERERAEKAKHEAAAALARQDIDAAQPASADHPYLVTKRLAPDGWLQSGDHLIVPMRDADGTFINRQTISGDGQKRFRAGGRKKGAFSVFGPSPSPDTQRLVIAEGAATAASIAASIPESTVIAAMDCGNLTPVAETLRRLCPAAVIVVAADDDCETPGNPGLRHAEQAAKAVKGSVAIPRIEGVASACDVSDVFLVAGAERVAAAVEERFARHQNAPPWDEPGRASDDRAEPFDATTAEEILAFDEYDAGQPKGAADATPANSAWRKHMLRKMDGELRASAIENGRLVLANTPAYRDLFGFDLFRGCVTVTKRPSRGRCGLVAKSIQCSF
jgi:putative DNA primase/helicase